MSWGPLGHDCCALVKQQPHRVCGPQHSTQAANSSVYFHNTLSRLPTISTGYIIYEERTTHTHTQNEEDEKKEKKEWHRQPPPPAKHLSLSL